MKVVENTTFHTLYSIYIYIFKSFPTFSQKIVEIYKETDHSKRKRRKSLCILAETAKNKPFCGIYTDILCVSSCICGNHLVGNDNGEFAHDFVAEQTTHTRHRCKNKSASHNIPPATRICFEACRVADFFDFTKNFWYNLYRK